QAPARVGAGEAERAVLGMGVVEERVAVRARTDVIGRIAHVRRVAVDDAPGAVGVAYEDAVVAERRLDAVGIGRCRGDVVAPPGADADLARAVAAVPPDLVALATVRAGQVVADSEVLDVDPVGLVDVDPVAPVGCELLVGGAPRAWR